MKIFVSLEHLSKAIEEIKYQSMAYSLLHRKINSQEKISVGIEIISSDLDSGLVVDAVKLHSAFIDPDSPPEEDRVKKVNIELYSISDDAAPRAEITKCHILKP